MSRLQVGPLWACAFLLFLDHHAFAQPSHEQFTRITTNREVASQVRQTYDFPRSGVSFDTDFDGARMAEVQETGPRSFTVTVVPENVPINDSAWYAFRISPLRPGDLLINLQYEDAPHRYWPRISEDGDTWSKAEAANSSEGGPRFKVPLGSKPIYVAAQELLTSTHFQNWISSLTNKPFVAIRTIGQSEKGKPIQLIEISEGDTDADLVFILGRQHPPEVTGTIALKSFVTALCETSRETSDYRKRFRTVVVPLVNPDGVDAGHWRHNANGADLNRDWGQFNQKETRVVRDELIRIASNSAGRLRLGIDFHSTRKDVFYTSYALGLKDDTGIRWLERLQQMVPDYIVRTEGNPTNRSSRTFSSASWMRYKFDAPAITYEVGDSTERGLIRKVARHAALALSQTLCVETSVGSQPTAGSSPGLPIRVALYKDKGVSGAGPGKILAWFSNRTDILVQPIDAVGIKEGQLTNCNVVIFPGGSGSGQAEAIGETGRELVREHVRDGGGYIGICAGAYLACSSFPWGLKVLDAKTASPKWQRGTGMVELELNPEGIATLGTARTNLVKYQNGPILVPAANPEIEDYSILGTYASEVAENGTPEGIMIHSPAVVAGKLGKGRVICFGPHPEQSPGLEPLLEAAIQWAAHQREGKAQRRDMAP